MFENIDISEVWKDEGFIIVKPRAGVEKGEAVSSAIWQAKNIPALIPALVREYGIKTVWWDTITATARNTYDHFANMGGSKAFNEGGVVVYENDWTNFLRAQNLIRAVVRKPLVNPADGRNYHLWCTLHAATRMVDVGKDGKGQTIKRAVETGPDAGGPSTVGDWGKEFSYVWRVYTEASKTGVKRFLQLDTMRDKDNIEVKARTASGVGDVPMSIEIPNNFEGSRETMRKALAYGGFNPENPEKYGYVGGTIYGAQGVGKTLLTSAFLGLANTKPCLYIAADGDAEFLRSMWAEVKLPVNQTKNES